jgi:toxin ParE1/3/4
VKRRVTIKDSAIADLDAIYLQGLERWGPDQARAYLEALDRLFDLLSEQPDIARERKEISPAVHIHPFRSHVVIYGVSSAECDILRVVHSRSDWNVLLATL